MIEVAELYEKVTGHKFFNDFCFNYPEKERPPIRLLKSETGLAANIVNVEYWVSLELGTWQYIEVQNDTADEIHEEKSFWILFDENASLTSDYDIDSPPELPESPVKAMQDFVRSSFSDQNSRLFLLMQERKAQWEADVKETRNKNLERQKNASSEIVMNADKARTNQNKK